MRNNKQTQFILKRIGTIYTITKIKGMIAYDAAVRMVPGYNSRFFAKKFMWHRL